MVLENNYPLLKHIHRQYMVIVSKIYAAADSSKIKSSYVLPFAKKCASGLLLAGKRPSRTPRRPKKLSLSPTPNVGKKPTVADSVLDNRYYGIHHWPEFREARNLCRVCSSTVRSIICVYVYRKEEIVFMISITHVVKPDQKLTKILLPRYS